MGTCPAFARSLALHDSNGGAFSVELSLVAVFSFGSRDLRGRSVASATGVIRLRRGYGGQADPSYSGTRSHGPDSHGDANCAYDWLVRFPTDMDHSWTRGVLVS